MVHRFVFVKLQDSARRAEVASSARAAFAAVDVVRGFDVLEPADPDSEVWDLCFRVQFASLDDVPVYIDDPAHAAFVRDVLSPAAEVKKAWNFRG